MAKISSDLTVGKITKLIRTIAIPAVVGTFFQTLYNIVDVKFAGMISPYALTGLSKVFPVYFVIIALSAGLSIGATALVSNYLGKKDFNKASLIFSQSIVVAIMGSIFVAVFGIYIAPIILKFLSTDANTFAYAIDYINVIFIGSIIFFLLTVSNVALTARGDTKSYRNVLIFGFFLNIALNPLFIYGLGPVPAMGVSGIAIATLCAEFIALIYILSKVLKTEIKDFVSLDCFFPKKNMIIEILKQAMPTSISMVSVGFGIFILFYFVSLYSDVAAGGYGAGVRFEQLFLLPIIGLNTSTLALVGQNYGALKFERIKEIYDKTIVIGITAMIIGGTIIYLLSGIVMGFFTDDPEQIYYGSQYLKIAAFIGPVYPIFFISGALFQGLKKAHYQTAINLLRMIIFPLIFLTIGVKYFDINFREMFLILLVINWIFGLLVLFFSRRLITQILSKDN
ncbi:MATE family efflux transporter [Pelagibacterales bacterium]|jgi:putative MATE family efflux protein|nr:MATE family efflux transporter [Pelagibacterales bacterium]MDB4220276.1 MATE family efflux transporter [Pelagibacterales bacterium]|tara:strand:+ start:550 stop:1908 length:1359 start_codon:yes stop_codon:yes gene_type:complete